MRVRYRIDGVLQDVASLPKNAQAGLTSRIKVMADMDITERRRPQDGRIALRIDGEPLDLRVATLPTPLGEGIVIRVLNSGVSFHSIDDLGLSADNLAKFVRMLHKPYGCVLIAGPTGSGKTTTLYAALQSINEPTRKIITIEDPIEYRMSGLSQVAVNPRVALTFAAGLRTALRFDPDVVMVGEVRDPETASIAVRAALTGHLVLSSIHTNDAPSALTRITDMGVESYVTSSALLGCRRATPRAQAVPEVQATRQGVRTSGCVQPGSRPTSSWGSRPTNRWAVTRVAAPDSPAGSACSRSWRWTTT